MKKEYDELLVKKYPEIFKDRQSRDPRKTLMCFGFECGDGWFELLDNLCFCIMKVCKEDKLVIPEATQVKEKFGGLRFYVNNYQGQISDCIRNAEELSYNICEVCGCPGKLRNNGWMCTLCDIHAKENNYND